MNNCGDQRPGGPQDVGKHYRGPEYILFCKAVGDIVEKGRVRPFGKLDLRFKWPEALKRDKVTKRGHGA